MSKQKSAKTLMERFGFKDTDLSTPEHDEILLWLLDKRNALQVLLSVGCVINPKYSVACIHQSRYAVRRDRECDWKWKDFCCTGICDYSDISKPQRLQRHAFAFKKAMQPRSQADTLTIHAEEPILGYNNYNIGFADAKITVNQTIREFGNVDDDCFFNWMPPFVVANSKYYVEIKPNVKSIGELIRQINLYKSHLHFDNEWILLTKTKGLKDIMKSQQISVFEWSKDFSSDEQKKIIV
jgi:hypothetical protein